MAPATTPSADLGPSRSRRRRGTREETEGDLIAAALRLLERNGVLTGVTLREVATEAGVNHGQIYQYFGTRQKLLRAGLARWIARDSPDPDQHWSLPFVARRQSIWRHALRKPQYVKLQALLALDGDTEFKVFPALEQTRRALARDIENGDLPADADGDVVHAMTASTYLGYSIFREAMANDLGITLAELDERAAAVFDQMLAGVQQGAQPRESAPAESARPDSAPA